MKTITVHKATISFFKESERPSISVITTDGEDYRHYLDPKNFLRDVVDHQTIRVNTKMGKKFPNILSWETPGEDNHDDCATQTVQGLEGEQE